MSNLLAHAIHDRLPGGADIVDVPVKIEGPAECLRRRADVVFRRGEHDDRRGDGAKIKGRAIARLELIAGQLVANEQVIDQELQLITVQLDEIPPPPLELQVARFIGIDMCINVVLLAP